MKKPPPRDVELVLIHHLLLNISNPNFDRKQVQEMSENWDPEKFQPITVYPEGQRFLIVDGNHRALALTAIGSPHVLAVILNKEEFDYVAYSDRGVMLNVLPLKDGKAKAYNPKIIIH